MPRERQEVLLFFCFFVVPHIFTGVCGPKLKRQLESRISPPLRSPPPTPPPPRIDLQVLHAFYLLVPTVTLEGIFKAELLEDFILSMALRSTHLALKLVW